MSDIELSSEGRVPPDKSIATIKVQGDIKIRLIVLIIVGLLLTIITIGGLAGLYVNEAAFGKHWQGFQAIISGAIFGLVGFIAGQGSGSRHSNDS